MENKALESEIFNLEKKFWNAMKEKDVATMMDLSDDQCIIAGPQGISKIHKNNFAAMMESEQSRLLDFKLDEDYKVTILNDTAAVIAYKVREDLNVEGKSVTLNALDSSTWIKKGNRWVCSMHTEALSGDPYGRDRKPQTIQ